MASITLTPTSSSKETESCEAGRYSTTPNEENFLQILRERLESWCREVEGTRPQGMCRKIASFKIQQAAENRERVVDVSDLELTSLPDLGDIEKYLPRIKESEEVQILKVRGRNCLPSGFKLFPSIKNSSLWQKRHASFHLRSIANSTLLQKRRALRNF